MIPVSWAVAAAVVAGVVSSWLALYLGWRVVLWKGTRFFRDRDNLLAVLKAGATQVCDFRPVVFVRPRAREYCPHMGAETGQVVLSMRDVLDAFFDERGGALHVGEDEAEEFSDEAFARQPINRGVN